MERIANWADDDPFDTDAYRSLPSIFSKASRAKLHDLATRPGQIAPDVQEYFSEIGATDQLPLMARTIKNEKLTKQKIQRLIRDLKQP